MTDLSRYFATLTYQRSGSNMLGWAINEHPDITYIDEVFHPERGGRPRNFNHLLAILDEGERPRSRHGPTVPYNDPSAKRILVDVKYNQANDAVKQFLREVPVIHLIRLDDKRHWQSFVLREFWTEHLDMRFARELPESLPFDRRRYEAFVARKNRYIGWGKALADLTLVYEALCDNEQIDQLPYSTALAICELAGVDFQPFPVPTIKSAIEFIPWRHV